MMNLLLTGLFPFQLSIWSFSDFAQGVKKNAYLFNKNESYSVVVLSLQVKWKPSTPWYDVRYNHFCDNIENIVLKCLEKYPSSCAAQSAIYGFVMGLQLYQEHSKFYFKDQKQPYQWWCSFTSPTLHPLLICPWWSLSLFILTPASRRCNRATFSGNSKSCKCENPRAFSPKEGLEMCFAPAMC